VSRGSALALAALLVACQRKAPGPEECRRFAVQALGIPAGAKAISPQAYSALEELTRQCITTPFDRELVRCVDDGHPARRCLASYEDRALRRKEQ
jgi:hypothetical protein